MLNRFRCFGKLPTDGNTIPVLRRVAWLLSVIVLVVACAKLAEFLGGINFGIDAWFVRNPGRFGAVPTGRMSPITAANFIFTAAGLFVLAHPCLQKWADVFGAVATAVAAIVLTGYCYARRCSTGGGSSRLRFPWRARFCCAELPLSSPQARSNGRCACFTAIQRGHCCCALLCD
jgi:hypothetical protein